MKTRLCGLILLAFFPWVTNAAAVMCPDPNNSSLSWGEVPSPWQVSPASQNYPQGEDGTHFVRANVLVAGVGRGLACTYQNTIGFYSIWWPVSVSVPNRFERQWRRTLGGYECTDSIEFCVFYTGKN